MVAIHVSKNLQTFVFNLEKPQTYLGLSEVVAIFIDVPGQPEVGQLGYRSGG